MRFLFVPLKNPCRRWRCLQGASQYHSIFSEASATLDTRFWPGGGAHRPGRADLRQARTAQPDGRRAHRAKEAAGPADRRPCTGNTLAKLARGVADSTVTLACKAHLRNERPIVLAVSSNDALAGNAASLGKLLTRRYFYFVPSGQDSPMKKPASLVADFTKLPETVDPDLQGKQFQPMFAIMHVQTRQRCISSSDKNQNFDFRLSF